LWLENRAGLHHPEYAPWRFSSPWYMIFVPSFQGILAGLFCLYGVMTRSNKTSQMIAIFFTAHAFTTHLYYGTRADVLDSWHMSYFSQYVVLLGTLFSGFGLLGMVIFSLVIFTELKTSSHVFGTWRVKLLYGLTCVTMVGTVFLLLGASDDSLHLTVQYDYYGLYALSVPLLCILALWGRRHPMLILLILVIYWDILSFTLSQFHDILRGGLKSIHKIEQLIGTIMITIPTGLSFLVFVPTKLHKPKNLMLDILNLFISSNVLFIGVIMVWVKCGSFCEQLNQDWVSASAFILAFAVFFMVHLRNETVRLFVIALSGILFDDVLDLLSVKREVRGNYQVAPAGFFIIFCGIVISVAIALAYKKKTVPSSSDNDSTSDNNSGLSENTPLLVTSQPTVVRKTNADDQLEQGIKDSEL